MARQLSDMITAYDAMTPEEKQAWRKERMQRKADEYNASTGKLKDGYTISTMLSDSTRVDGDGYDCPLCLNRGNFMRITEANGMLYEQLVECKCMTARRSIWRMKASGLEKSIRENTFKSFTVSEPWQQSLLDTARKYLAEGVPEGRWLYMGGQPGSGKTHLCTAVARELLRDMPVSYIVWPETSKRLKAIVNEPEYGEEIGRLQEIQALYIDDFFKPVTGEDRYGERRVQSPTAADLKLAFEILNYRYINRLPTILSSEWYLAELADFDEATASRIAERARGYCAIIGRDRQRNMRYAGAEVL